MGHGILSSGNRGPVKCPSMGIQEPLTAQALGRSPYDDVFEGEGDAETNQQYDYRGRPINPETRRINRDIVRAHNEVMLVIGVAEADTRNGVESEPQARHAAHEEAIGLKLASPAKRCLESVGIFGVHGMRQRILIYKRYSQIPFWDLVQRARKDSFLTRNVLAGAPTSLVTNYIDLYLRRRCVVGEDNTPVKNVVHYAWSFFRLHLELYVALQRLGLISNKLLLPSPKFFVPFTAASPIPAPAAPVGFSFPSLMRWLGAAVISAAPFIAWSMAMRLVRDLKPHIWSFYFSRLPSTTFQAKPIQQSRSDHRSRSSTMSETGNEDAQEDSHQLGRVRHDSFRQAFVPLSHTMDGNPTDQMGTPDTLAERASASYAVDEYTSSEDDNEVVSATLISFDVEASEPTDAPPGLWSAELRPSAAQDLRTSAGRQVVYCDTLLTQLPALIGAGILTETLSRLHAIPCEGIVLRLVARSLRQRQGLPCEDIHPARLLTGVTWTYALNLIATEFLHMVISSSTWAVFSALSVWYHKTEEEWLADEAKASEEKVD